MGSVNLLEPFLALLQNGEKLFNQTVECFRVCFHNCLGTEILPTLLLGDLLRVLHTLHASLRPFFLQYAGVQATVENNCGKLREPHGGFPAVVT